MRITQEQIDRANAVNLPQFLIEHGFELKRMSRDEFMWKEHESLFIHDNQNGESGKWFRFSENHGGDNIAFVREYMDLNFRQAVELLNDETYIDTQFRPYPHQKPKFRVSKPDKPVEIHLHENPDCRKVMDYLCRVRGLDFSLVSELINQGRISQESGYYGNAIFKYFDENNRLVGAEKCGTTEGQKFKSIEKGSASGYGFEVVRGNGENALFFESAIDMLSYLQMHPELDNHRLVSMMGVKPSIVVATMERHGIKPENVYLCSDNDDAGNDFADRLKEVYPEIKRLCSDKKYKDWNDQLREIPIKEVTTEKMIVYGNKIWNYATDNSDKTIISFDESRFKDFVARLEDSGLNYYAYLHENKVIMAVNDGDIANLQRIVGDDFQTTKSNRPYNPPMKNIIGNTPYRDIYPKEYINLDRDTALKLAQILEKEGIHYSGRIYPNGKATLTVSRNDRRFVENLKENLYNQRKRYTENIPCEGVVGNTDYHEIVNRKIIFSDYTREQFQEREPFIGNQMQYAGVIQNGKIMFMTEEQNETNFRNLLKRADNIVAIRHECEHKNLSEEQINSLQDLIEKCAETQNLSYIPAFFDARYSVEQFQQMKQAVSSYLDKAQTPENSELQNLKAEFDKQADLSDFFSHHDYDAEQKAAISENYDLIQSTSAFELIDESFSSDQISEYFAILRSTGYEDAEKFAENHRMMMNMSDEMLDYYSALSNHEPVYLHKESRSEFQNERIEFQEDSGFVIVGDTENESDLIHYHFQTNSPEVMISNVFESGWFEQNGYVLDGLENPHVTEEIDDSFIDFGDIPETKTELTDEEKFFKDCDIVSVMTKNVLASDEIEDLAYRFYESGYIETHAPSDMVTYGNHLAEHDLYDLIYDMYSGNDISKDLAVGLIGTAKNGYAHYGETYSDYIEFSKEQTDTGFHLTYGGVQRDVTYQELSDKFLSMFREEYDDIQKYRDAEKQAETPEKPELTEHEKYFQECDISAIMAKNALAENEIERLGFIFFQERYIQNHNPLEQRVFGWNLPESDAYILASHHECGENISKDLCSGIFGDYDTGWLKHGEDTLQFGKKTTETGVLLSYENVQREVSYQELANAFLNLFHEKFEEITHNRLMNYFSHNIPDIDEKTAENLIHAFDEAKRPDWQDNLIKRRRIKNALFEILNDEEKTEKAFSIISFWKYDYDEKYDAPEKTPVVEESPIHFGLFGNGVTVYDTSRTNPETDDYVTVAHISPEGILNIYDDNISDSDMQKIQNEAQSQREHFMQDWNHLSLYEQYEKILDNADISTQINIFKEEIPVDKRIEKYMPFVFFKEGERPEPELAVNVRTEEEKQSTLKNDLIRILGEEQADTFIPELMKAFENNPVSSAEDDPVKEGELKAAMFDILGDEEQTEEVYSAFLDSTNLYSSYARQNYDIIPQNGTYSIYQLHGGEEYHGIRFESLETLQKENVVLNHEDYEKVYEGELSDFKGKQTLEELFEKFNIDRPADFTGHSLSMSDIIVTEIDGEQTAYYCDRFGFTEMPDFFKEKAIETEISEPEPEYDDFSDIDVSAMKKHLEETKPEDSPFIQQVMADAERISQQEISDNHDNQLERAKQLISDYVEEFDVGVDFDDLSHVNLAFRFDKETKLPIMVYADLENFSIIKEYNDKIVSVTNYDSLEIMCEDLEKLRFNELVALSDEEKAKVKSADNPEIQEVPDNQTIDEDAPLFTDADVIQTIQENEHADDFRFYPDTEGEQLSLFGEPEPIPSKNTSKQKEEQYKTGLVVGGVNRFKALSDDVMRGTGFQDGKFRVQEFYQKNHPTNQEFADFLKKAYGTGAHSGDGDISFVDYNSKGMIFTLETGEKFKFTWSEVAEEISEKIQRGEYLTQQDMETHNRLSKTEPIPVEDSKSETRRKIEIGDKFRNKISGEICEVISLTGAMPWYADQCTISKKSGMFEVTENISDSDLLNPEKYERVLDKEKVIETPAPEKKPFSEEIAGADHNIKYHISETSDEQHKYNVQILTSTDGENFSYSGNGRFCETLDDARNFVNQDIAERQEKNVISETPEPEVKLQSIVIDLTALRDENAKIPDEPKKDFHITNNALGEGGQKAKFQANIQAIKTLKTLEKEKRPATPEEKETLSRYVGWGGIAQAFDANNEKWSTEYQQLKELLTNQEYSSARASTLNAFYTTPLVIDSIYQALENFGFEGGNILEPSCGVGNFFGCMPEDMRKESALYGVELDSISGRIAQKIYPDAEIAIQGFEKNEFQNGCFDVAVGNVPFGDLSFKDDKHQTTKLHDYFFAEALDKVKTGGIIAFVTSAGTLDKADERTRQALADKADLIGAIRLPSTAFKQNANTEVTTDIIFLQKHGDKPISEMLDFPEWVHLGETENSLPINKYFERNPDMVLGTVVEGNKLYGKSGTMVIPTEGADLKEQLQTAVSKLSATISDERARDVYAKTEHGEVKIPSNLRNYSFFEHENHIYFKTSDRICSFRFDRTNSHHRRAKAFIELRDTTRELLTAQELDKPDSEIKELQAKLNRIYDNFYKKYGLLHNRTNKKLFSEDVSYNLVCSLEKEIDKDKLVAKSDLFTKRTIRPPQAVEHVDSASEALTLSMAEKAKVNFQYMSELTGLTEDELKKELEGQIFKVPHTENEYQTASEYLSGDIYKKLKEVQEVAEYDSDFSINVSALKQAIPTPLKAGDIEVKIGAAWIDPKLYQQFLYETLNTPYQYRDTGEKTSGFWRKPKLIQVEYSKATGTFHIEHKREDMSVNSMQNFGTRSMNAYEIMEHLLNLKEPKIYKTVKEYDEYGAEKEKRVLDSDATRVVQKKAEKLREEFSKWIFKDPQRREQLVNQYNEQFNSVRPREYDGSALKFPMMNSEIQLHEHQKNAVAHALFGGNTLFAHTVGAGKTFEMIATAMEAKRLGLCTKSLFAVPNHLTEQIGDDFMKLYPSAHILVATKNDFKKENRQQLFAKIATGNFDAVIIGHSQLGMIPVSKERQTALIQEQIDDIIAGIEELKQQDGSKFQVKQMERTRKSLEAQLEKLEKNHDDTITFEQMGIDRLFVDEMHEFKNLFVKTKLSNISGVSTSASQKALDLFLKVRYLDEKTGGKGFIAATGTPLSNSVTELHTMMRYLEYDFLQEHNLQNFDNWVTIFGQQKTDWELAPAGNRFKERTRIANYTGMPELMCMFKQIADIRTPETMKLDVPKHEMHVVNVEATDFQQELVQELSDRADAINSGNVDPSIDNMLRITSDGRKLGLDPRLIDPSFEDNPETKLNKCVENVAKIYAETSEQRLTQVIFCDLGVPHKSTNPAEKENPEDGKEEKSSAERESLEEECEFCVYDDIRDKLIAKGIPAEEIAYIHDAKTEKQKADLFEKVRNGEIRCLIGSTSKMGTGTNIQKKLIAVHDLDIPWRPADLQQRAGRVIRQGNENKNVHIYRYVTKGTFDAYSYQTLEKKQRFISQIMTAKDPSQMMRKCEDVDQQALSYSEIKALCTGDERVKEKLMLDNEVKELEVLSREHQNTVYEMQDKITKFPEQEQKFMTALENLKTDREHLRKLPIDPETRMPVFKITIDGTEYTDRKEAAKAFEDAVLKACTKADVAVKIGEFQGFPLSVTLHSAFGGGGLSATLNGAYPHYTKLGKSASHNLQRLEGCLYSIDRKIDDVQNDLARLRVDHEEAQKIVAEPFAQETELKEKKERLKTLTDELNHEAAEARKNAPKREKTCYFERAKLKKEVMKQRSQEKSGKSKKKEKKKPSIDD